MAQFLPYLRVGSACRISPPRNAPRDAFTRQLAIARASQKIKIPVDKYIFAPFIICVTTRLPGNLRYRVITQPTVSEELERAKGLRNLTKRYTAPAPQRVSPTLDPTPTRQAMIVAHLPLAKKLARRKCKHLPDLEDWTQSASLGLIEGVDQFAGRDGFDGLVRLCIYTTMTDWELRGAAKRPRGLAPRTSQQLCAQARTKLHKALGRRPTNKEIADAIGWDERDVRVALFRGDRIKYIKERRDELWATLQREPEDAEVAAAARCPVEHVTECLSLSKRVPAVHLDALESWDPEPVSITAAVVAAGLTPAQQLTVKLRFSFAEPTFREMGQRMNVHPSRAKQLLDQAISKIRKVA